MQKRFTPLKLLEKQTHQRRVLIHLYRMFQQVLLFQRQKQPASPGRSSQKEKTLHRLGWCHSPGRKLPTMQKYRTTCPVNFNVITTDLGSTCKDFTG